MINWCNLIKLNRHSHDTVEELQYDFSVDSHILAAVFKIKRCKIIVLQYICLLCHRHAGRRNA